MQYSPIRGQAALIDAIIAFLRRDNIRLEPIPSLFSLDQEDRAGNLFKVIFNQIGKLFRQGGRSYGL